MRPATLPRLKLYINGRSLTHAITGVPRFARCVITAMDDFLAEGGAPDIDATVLVPRDAAVPPLRHMAIQTIGRRGGQLWEQVDLPSAAAGSVLLNLGNTAPARHRRNVVMIYDAVIWEHPSSYDWRFRAWYSALLPFIARRALAVVSPSHFSANALAPRLGVPPGSIEVIPGGADHLLRLPPPSAAATSLSASLADRPFVLAVIGATRHKNAPAVRAAAAQLAPLGVTMVVVQTTWHAARGAHISHGPNVRLVREVDDATLRDLYTRAICLFHPSRYEGFGLPPLEAMSLGCPVVASRAGSLPEVLGSAALYGDPQDARTFVDHIDRLLTNETECVALATAGRERAGLYTWRRTAEALLDVARRCGDSTDGPRRR